MTDLDMRPDADRNRREILVRSTEQGFYTEGYSPAVFEKEGGSGWFCFENATSDEQVHHLRELGFTDIEIGTPAP